MRSFFSRLMVSTLSVAIVASAAFVALQHIEPANAAAYPPTYVRSVTHDFGNLVDAAGESLTVSRVAGAQLGDACVASTGVSTAGGTLTCNISAAGTAIVRLQNESGGALDLASTTVRVYLIKAPSHY